MSHSIAKSIYLHFETIVGPSATLSKCEFHRSRQVLLFAKGAPHESISFDYFQIEKLRLKTIWAWRVDKKNWGHLFTFPVLLLSYGS